MESQNQKAAGVIFTLFGGIFWGLSGACGQYLFEFKGITANWLVPVRLVLAGSIMLVISLINDSKTTLSIWKTRENVIDLVIYSIAGMTLCQYSYFVTIENSNAGTATVLQNIALVIILAFICITEKRFPKTAELIAVICAIIGVFLIATHGDINHMVISKKALFFGMTTAIALVIYNLQPHNLLKQFNPFMIIAWSMVIGGTFLSAVFKPWTLTPVIDTKAAIAMLAILFFGTILSFTFYFQGVKLIGASHASLYACIEPLVASLLSVFWLKVSFQPFDYAGFLLIIATILILSAGSREKGKIATRQG